MEIKTLKQYEYDKKRCSYCKGTGQDIFNKEKPCPNCSKITVFIGKQNYAKLVNKRTKDNKRGELNTYKRLRVRKL